jgi:hypothetical protein
VKKTINLHLNTIMTLNRGIYYSHRKKKDKSIFIFESHIQYPNIDD